MRTRPLDRAVVIGGSFAGLTAAAALAERAREVVVLECRPMPHDEPPTSVAPHGSAPHLLLAGGALALENLVPGLGADLVDHGAQLADDRRRCHWWAAGAVRRAFPDLEVDVPLCTRALVETRLRARVRMLDNVVLLDEVIVRSIDVADGWVRGLRMERHGEPSNLDADLVVDASGRGSRSSAWLAEAGVPEPPLRKVEIGVTYTSVDVRRNPGDLDGGIIAVVQNTPQLARLGLAATAEGDRWRFLLGGYFGDAAPPTRDGMFAFVRSLPDPVLVGLLENEWLAEPTQYRFPSSQRRHWEEVRGLPGGFCAVGDSVASFNPLYGQGMSSAAQQVEALVGCLDRLGNRASLGRAVARATAKIVANPWQIATGGDFVYPQTQGRKAPGTDFVNRYIENVMAAAASDEDVNLALTKVQHLLAPPSSLLTPGTMLRVRRTLRRTLPTATLEPTA
jgi:2-polyprenyl-6-methoxyphenol hydroxylase-like FAD-dependent oxidoreductase